MGIETVRCPTCDAEIAVGVPRGGSVLDVTDRAPVDDHGTFEDGAGVSVPDEGSEQAGTGTGSGARATKHRAITCPKGHDFGFRFTV